MKNVRDLQRALLAHGFPARVTPVEEVDEVTDRAIQVSPKIHIQLLEAETYGRFMATVVMEDDESFFFGEARTDTTHIIEDLREAMRETQGAIA